MYAENFMCHHRFTIKFGRYVNFVTGENGAGKSAIVAAIQLCLGANARTAGRATALGTDVELHSHVLPQNDGNCLVVR